MSDGAGWFADPSGKINTFRWWDGRAWTRWLSADPAAPDPGPVRLGLPPEPPPVGVPPPAATPAYAPPDPADRVVRLPAAAAILVVGVLLAVIAVGAIISVTADRPLTGPAVAPPPPTESPLVVTYDSVSRVASADELRVVLPAGPFRCDVRPRDVPGVFPSSFGCNAPVHPDYNKEKSDWVAVTGLGVVDEDLKSDPDLTAIANLTFNAVVVQNYDLDDITMKKRKTERLTEIAPAGQAVLVSADIHVDYAGLPTEYDRAVVAVFALESGEHAAWFALRPEDSPQGLTDALDASARTVTARK